MDLTKQQKVITELLLQGLSKKQIADKLFVSMSTVSTHIARIMKKNDVHSIGAICGLFVDDIRKENEKLKQKVEYYKRYKKMWDLLKLKEFQESKG